MVCELYLQKAIMKKSPGYPTSFPLETFEEIYSSFYYAVAISKQLALELFLFCFNFRIKPVYIPWVFKNLTHKYKWRQQFQFSGIQQVSKHRG